MLTIQKMQYLKKQPLQIFVWILQLKLFQKIPDNLYLKTRYILKTKKRLNIEHPTTYNEKIQWLKLYNREHSQTMMADKYEVRSFISEKVGDSYLIPLIGVYNNIEEINFHQLPDQFVLKCTHDSGSFVICTDKDDLNISRLKRQINWSLNRNYFYKSREWVYKNIKPKIIVEKLLTDASDLGVLNYKFYCFSGEPRLIRVNFDIDGIGKRKLFNVDWQPISESIVSTNDEETHIEKPEKLDEMLSIARTLSLGNAHLRVDMYYIKNKIYFGELTFYPGSGYDKFEPESFGDKVGDWIKLPDKQIISGNLAKNDSEMRNNE